jgi:hypothetical protein
VKDTHYEHLRTITGGDEPLSSPGGPDVDDEGRAYVTDQSKNDVKLFTPLGKG